jgi:hypothetical protein
MPRDNRGFTCSLCGLFCAKEFDLNTVGLSFLLTPVQSKVRKAQVGRYLFTNTICLFTSVLGWLIHIIHSSNNKHYFKYLFIIFGAERTVLIS